MGDIAERYRRVARTFTERARQVPEGAWDNPAPCEGWVARDIVRHMVEWMPSMLADAGFDMPQGPSVDDDPAGAWQALSDGIQAGLDDPAVATRDVEMRIGTFSWEETVATFMLGDVLVHTWDLARATGLDETLDPDEVHRLYAGMAEADEALRSSGHFGARVDVPDDADEQTKLIAFTGRTP